MNRVAPPGPFLLLALACCAAGADRPAPRAPRTPEAGEESPNKADGLVLPEDFTAEAGDGFATVEAKTEAVKVRWIVLGGPKLKFVELGKQLIVSVPTESGSITVFAVALVKDDLAIARCIITVRGARPPPGPAPGPAPAPAPAPTPAPAAGKLHVTLVFDYDRMTPDLAALSNSTTLRKSLADANCQLRVYPATDPILAARKLDAFVQKAGGAPALIVQDERGVVRAAERVTDEAGVLAAVNRVRGK
jgi:hypothetical protein